MNKTPDPGDTERDKVGPAAEDLVAALAERVGPFAQQAVEAVAPLAHQVSAALSPYAHQAAEAVTPYAQQVSEALSPYAQQAAEAVTPLAQQAAEAMAPYAALVREHGLRSGHELADRLEPALEAARVAAKDAFSGARDKVTSEYVPAVGAAAATAAASASPLVSAATDRGRSLVKSVRKEPAVVVPPPKKKRGWLATLAVVAAAAGATYVVVRRLVGDKGSQWQTARPTTPYAPPVSAEAGVATPTPSTEPAGVGETEVVASTTSLYGTVGSADATGAVDDTDGDAIAANTAKVDAVADVDEGADSAPAAGQVSGTWGEGSATDAAPATDTPSSDASGAASEHDGSSDGTFGGAGASTPFTDKDVHAEVAAAEERVYEEPESAVWAADDAAMGGGPDAHPERYDMAGAYVGVEPPVGYTIKGNERSMKYHLPDSNAYGRTIAQVWFATEEAAQQAGFTRAGH
ncbi:MAG: hypothetical protein ACRYG2_23775 [Janthinobacterium lividum]